MAQLNISMDNLAMTLSQPSQVTSRTSAPSTSRTVPMAGSTKLFNLRLLCSQLAVILVNKLYLVQYDSQIRYRKVKEECVSVSGYGSLLNPGRDCGEDIQCITQRCKEGQCLGLIENENCHSDSDCAAGSYCRIAINWPYRGLCSRQKGVNEACRNDYEC